MIAELQVSHAYIQGGDMEIPDRPGAGFPGARFAWDADAGRYRIARIFEGHNEGGALPLAAPRGRRERRRGGLPARHRRRGAPRGREPLPAAPPQVRPADRVHRERRAGLRGGPEGDLPARRQRGSADLPERDRGRTAGASRRPRGAGSATSTSPTWARNGIREFIKWYYSQVRREGMIVDVRRNGGGNISQMLIERFPAGDPLARLLADERGGEHLSGRRAAAAPRLPARRELGLRRRHLPGHVQEGPGSAR